MTKAEQLSNLVELRNGYLSITEAQGLGISRTYIQEYIATNGFERVARGLYKSSDVTIFIL